MVFGFRDYHMSNLENFTVIPFSRSPACRISLSFLFFLFVEVFYLYQEGIVFGAICLSVSEQDYGKTAGPIPIKLRGRL